MTVITRRAALLAGTILLAAGPVLAASPVKQQRPNIIFVLVDDLRWDEFGAAGHPWLETPNIDRLAREGAMFTEAIHAIPLCSPNRATLLTGQYPSRHGVTGNEARSELSHRLDTFPRALNAAGYHTGFIGKWHMGNDPTPRPGFDYWVSFPGQGKIIDPQLYENGKLTKTPGYVTDLLSDRAVGFLAAAPADKPFFLALFHKAIHPDSTQRNDGSIDLTAPAEFIPAPRDAGRYADKTFPRRANYVPPDVVPPGDSHISGLLRQKYAPQTRAKYGAETDASTSDKTIRGRSEMLLSIDDGLGRLFRQLESTGQIDNTIIILSGDNGYFYGEHGLSTERRLPYEEAVRAPLLVRWPGRVKAGAKIDTLVSSVDLAPTVLDLAGVSIGPQVQGLSFAPALLGRKGPERQAAYTEYNGDEVFDWVDQSTYRAVRTRRWKLIRWVQDPTRAELYDLVADPYEMTNLYADPRYAKQRATLEAELKRQSNAALAL
jgi:N-acetylglucosamine-6-sulfatase